MVITAIRADGTEYHTNANETTSLETVFFIFDISTWLRMWLYISDFGSVNNVIVSYKWRFVFKANKRSEDLNCQF